MFPFLTALGSGLQGFANSPLGDAFGSLMGGLSQRRHLQQGRSDIQNLPGMAGPQGVAGNFGAVDPSGVFAQGAGDANFQAGLQQQGGNLLQGGLFNDPRFQAAFQGNDIAGALGQSNQALGAQQGAQQFGGLGGLFDQQQGLAGQFAQQTAAGPQDFFGGAGGALRSAGVQNQLAAGDQTGLQNAELATLRAAGQPAMDRQFNRLQDRLFSTGQLGSTGGGEQLRGLFEAQGQQDLNFQQEAFNRALSQGQFQGQLGAQQFGQGAQALGQNLGQFNQNAQFANMFGQGAAGIEGQGFNQQLGANQFNTSQGMNRVNQALGLFGQGADVFGQQFGHGLQAGNLSNQFNQFGLEAARTPFDIQSGLLGSSSGFAGPLQANAAAQANASGGLFGNLFSDARLKDNINRIGKFDELGWYEWDWNEKAKAIGADKEPSFGFIAQEVAEHFPEAIGSKDGYLTVNYGVVYNGS